MSMFTDFVVNGLLLPAPGLTVSEARDMATNITGQDLPAQAEEMAKAVQSQQKEPAISTPESIENGEVSVKTQPTLKGA